MTIPAHDETVPQQNILHPLDPLSADEIIYLKQNGVSDQVIQELQAGGNGQPRVVYTEWITGPVDVTESVPRDSSRPLLPK